MDPHSRRSQFSHRAPKAGPVSRNIEPPQTTLKSETSKMPSKKSKATAASTNLLIRRPIATNSRVKQVETFKRDMYLSVVSNALQQKANGVSTAFDELVSQFNISSSPSRQLERVDTAQIRLWLLALSHVVSRLERTHSVLVDAIVNMPWTTLDSATVKSYTEFIGMLISARPEYLSLVLAKIAQGFTYQSGLQALDSSMPSTSNTPLTRRIIYDRLHYLLQHVLTLVPTLPSTLQPFLIRHFPHKRQNQVSQTTFIRNILRISSYCPELSEKILATIVDRAIQIDVEIQIELEELEEDGDGPDEHEVFELDPFDVVLGQEPSSDSDGSDDEDGDDFSDLSSDAGGLDGEDANRHVEIPTNVKHIQEMVKKLDAILMLLFEHFERTKSMSSNGLDLPMMSPPQLPPLPPLDGIIPGPPYTQSPTLGNPPPTTTLPTTSPKETRRRDTTSLRAQFHSLLSIFDRTILRTFKSRYTQFLVFWYASLDPEFADIFQGMLVDRAIMPSSVGGPTAQFAPSNPDGENNSDEHLTAHAHTMTPELTRAAAASYIGSFVSRATFVDREGARRVTAVLCEYLRTHLEGVEADLRAGMGFGTGSSSNNVSATIGAILASGQHTVFYAVAQAVFLIFCFRWRDLAGGDDDDELDLDLDLGVGLGQTKGGPVDKDKWMPEIAVLKRVVSSVLNPLKVCSPNVVMQFARVAPATDFIYCYTILESNKRAEFSVSSTSSTSATTTVSSSRRESLSTSMTLLHTKFLYEPANAELNTFFPFDPYRLPKSNVFIQGVYREWSSVAIDDDDDDDEDEEEDEDEEPKSSEHWMIGASSGFLDIPGAKQPAPGRRSDDGGLGESLGAMSISPVRMSIPVDMRH
ncbi:hypothetical protein M413DRAFT_441534 [Hebeloma cylindrosporum]|uniref:RNA polymerase I-specific transcription initiation factor RRN3 n=1 Tax=Hebeloma cylindrosporum TaxID=76867 RepID=A0A0C2Y9C0_HEBCY|nr:hypothetical protein M413DRAFT_441534 [Hebeloma cylindrosporum h7]